MIKKGLIKFDYTFKVNILGVSGVGISTFLRKYATEVFESIPIYKKVFISYKIIREINKNNTKSKIIEVINKVYQEILVNYRNLYLIHKDSRSGVGIKFKINIDTHCEPLTFHFMQNWARFKCEDSINIQPASDFVKTHTTAIEIIEVFKKYGFGVEIFDDTNYYRTKNIDLLSGKNREIDRLEKVGLEYYTKTLEINNKTFKIQIWHSILDDISTLSDKSKSDIPVSKPLEPKFLQILREKSRITPRDSLMTIKSICKGSNGALIMYDITNLNSLKLAPKLIQIIRENAGDIPILLVGNKVDIENKREVLKEESIRFAKKNDLFDVIEISAKRGQNCENVFKNLTKNLIYQLNYQA